MLIIIVVIASIAITTTISILLNKIDNLYGPSLGTKKTLGVKAYWDKNLENETKEVYWGTIYPGSSQNATFYVRSISNIETTLELKTANWTFQDSNNRIVVGPSDSSPYVNLTMNYNETIVRPDETVQVTVTLSVDHSPDFIEFLIANDVKEFSFDIIISTSEHID